MVTRARDAVIILMEYNFKQAQKNHRIYVFKQPRISTAKFEIPNCVGEIKSHD